MADWPNCTIYYVAGKEDVIVPANDSFDANNNIDKANNNEQQIPDVDDSCYRSLKHEQTSTFLTFETIGKSYCGDATKQKMSSSSSCSGPEEILKALNLEHRIPISIILL